MMNRRRPSGQRGLTLVEVLVAVGILTTASGLVGGGVFQVLSVQGPWRAELVATKDLRNAAAWFGGDAANAEATDLLDTAPPVGSVSLSWTDGEGQPHTAYYSVSSGALVRDLDGAQTAVARSVASAQFSLAGRLLTTTIEIDTGGGATQTQTSQTYLRNLDQ